MYTNENLLEIARKMAMGELNFEEYVNASLDNYCFRHDGRSFVFRKMILLYEEQPVLDFFEKVIRGFDFYLTFMSGIKPEELHKVWMVTMAASSMWHYLFAVIPNVSGSQKRLSDHHDYDELLDVSIELDKIVFKHFPDMNCYY